MLPLFLLVVGVLCQEAVHEQKPLSTWAVNNLGSKVSILHLPQGWMGGFLFDLGWKLFFCVAKMILYSLFKDLLSDYWQYEA